MYEIKHTAFKEEKKKKKKVGEFLMIRPQV